MATGYLYDALYLQHFQRGHVEGPERLEEINRALNERACGSVDGAARSDFINGYRRCISRVTLSECDRLPNGAAED
jgi:hypothetical protein